MVRRSKRVVARRSGRASSRGRTGQSPTSRSRTSRFAYHCELVDWKVDENGELVRDVQRELANAIEHDELLAREAEVERL